MEKVYLLMDYANNNEFYPEDFWQNTFVLGAFSTFDKAKDALANSPATDLLKEGPYSEDDSVDSDELKEVEFCGNYETRRFIDHCDGGVDWTDEIYIEEISLDELRRS